MSTVADDRWMYLANISSTPMKTRMRQRPYGSRSNMSTRSSMMKNIARSPYMAMTLELKAMNW